MLELLAEYAQSHGLLAEPGFKPKQVQWALVFGADGSFHIALPLGETVGSKRLGQTFARCPDLSQGEIKRGGRGCRHFLVDSADVVALLSDDDEPDAKLVAKHRYFVGLLRQASSAIPELAAFAATLEDAAALEKIRQELRAHKAKPADRVTFSMQGVKPTYFVESTAWHDWWREFRRGLGKAKDNGGEETPQEADDDEGSEGHESASISSPVSAGPPASARCLVSGAAVAPILTHPKINGLMDVGGLAMGDVLASFKQDAFCSFGLAQAENAPVSEQKGAEYAAALNQLIKEHSHKLAGSKVVHWFKKHVDPENDPFAWLESPPEDLAINAQRRAQKLLRAILDADPAATDLVGNHYYALTLSGASGRVMVRDWMEGSFEDLVKNVDQWFEDLAIVRRDGTDLAPPPKPWSLLASLVRDLKDLPASLSTALWRAAVRCEPIPPAAHALALLRFRSELLKEEPFNHARVGLLKAYHARADRGQPMATHLNEDHPNAAYQCGRLLAMLAALQYRALGDVGAGVVQRFYAAASATPSLVLGRLTRTSNFHLDKLERGLARWHEGRIAEVWARIDNVPATLSLDEQSLFALGYYQQIAHDRGRPRPEGPAETVTPSTAAEESEEPKNV